MYLINREKERKRERSEAYIGVEIGGCSSRLPDQTLRSRNR